MWMIETKSPELDAVLKCCGATSGYFGVEEFTKRYGINPLHFPQLFEVTPRNKLVCVKKRLEDLYKIHRAIVHNNQSLLGVR